MVSTPTNANAKRELGESTKQNISEPNTSKSTKNRQAKIYEILKQNFINRNPSCTSADYKRACQFFARLVGV